MSFTPNKFADFDLTTGLNDGSSWADAYQSMADVNSGVSAGDQVACRGTDTLSSGVVWTAGGSSGNPIWIRAGYNGSGVHDGTLALLDRQNNNYCIYFGSATNHLHFEYFHFHDADNCIYNVSADNISFSHCKFSEGNQAGLNATGERIVVRECIFDSMSGAKGIDQLGPGSRIEMCSFIDCQTGISVNGDYVDIIGCILHGGTGDGIVLTASATEAAIINNTIDGFGGDAVRLSAISSTTATLVTNNRITNNGGYGIDLQSGRNIIGDYNYFYNNTSGAVNSAGDYIGGDNDVNMSGDGYNDRANDDFNLTSDAEGRSVAIDIDGTNINYKAAGALNPEATGGRQPRARYHNV